MVLDLTHLIEYSVEIGYGIIYLVLAITTYKKYRETENKLALFFIGAFICFAASGLYGGIAGLLNKTAFEAIDKILEIYNGLALIALIFFIVGLLKL
ncbi:MAG TPA: hypothetical protein VGB37_14130 [Candidatus Lokiarchaeia archaeon]